MKIDAAAVRKCLKSFDFATLFREHLGWDNHHARLEIPAGDTTVVLTAVAQKRGFVAFLCPMIPDRPTRLKIDHKVTKSVREHFVIYTDQAKGRQVWHWVRREPGKPLASRNHRFDTAQSGDPLIQRLDQIAVSMDEEEAITVVDVVGRVKAALDVDKITKKFYDRFKAEHAAFLKLIKGIKADADLAWYTSLMLNRLMFVYFIQKKGFLDGDIDYLRNRLAMVQKLRGKDRFQTFYRYFLLRLFHDGLGKSPDERKLDPVMEKLLGRVPFLDGGFFEVHQLEEENPGIDIPDKAFEKLFAFFDRYRWHLDERPLRADNEINPDVVGYIFEKYINQKQMGAYYTKEDITEYISKNTLIPFLFDTAETKCPVAFKPDSFVWRLLREDPDRYLYPAVKHGMIREDGEIVPETELPDFVQAGMHDPKVRMQDKRYNLQQAPAGDPLRLVTETWREYVTRRTRGLEIREKLSKGEVHQINDLITLNLDIWQFARDAIVTSEGPELLRAFWQAIEKVTLLDPTCGSGAFLFAALRILETLYSDCLECMGRFIEDIENKPHHPKKFSDFKQVLARIGKHPSERYFILKSIIINNLYGVDIMAEAVEICKLRLFLKLVAQVETPGQIEPLPDMDFNIRAGNTLVGYATEEQARKAFTEEAVGKRAQKTLMFGDVNDAYLRFEEDLLIVEKSFQQFRAQQTTHGGRVTYKDKQDLRQRLEKLDAELDRYLASEYGTGANKYKSKTTYDEAFARWKASHQPFHWFAEFYGIMHGGGFDVIIGNPPYLESSKVKTYKVGNCVTRDCANLYVFTVEKSALLNSKKGRYGMIIPISFACSGAMEPLRQHLAHSSRSLWLSHFSNRPGQLFTGAQNRLTIFLASGTLPKPKIFSTQYTRWDARNGEREKLFPVLGYQYLGDEIAMSIGLLPKVGSSEAVGVLSKIRSNKTVALHISKQARNKIFWVRVPGYFCQFLTEPPMARPEKGGEARIRGEVNEIAFTDKSTRKVVHAVFNSSLYYVFFCIFTDTRHINPSDVKDFPLDIAAFSNRVKENLDGLSTDLSACFKSYTIHWRKSGLLIDSIDSKCCKPIIDEIDQVLAQHFGFTDEELDFIINYDIKYRMGRVESGEDEE